MRWAPANAPEHAGLLGMLANHTLAASFNDSGSDKVALLHKRLMFEAFLAGSRGDGFGDIHLTKIRTYLIKTSYGHPRG